jgi:hypothetical protein
MPKSEEDGSELGDKFRNASSRSSSSNCGAAIPSSFIGFIAPAKTEGLVSTWNEIGELCTEFSGQGCGKRPLKQGKL